jgi:hypothetical protein
LTETSPVSGGGFHVAHAVATDPQIGSAAQPTGIRGEHHREQVDLPADRRSGSARDRILGLRPSESQKEHGNDEDLRGGEELSHAHGEVSRRLERKQRGDCDGRSP